MQVFRPLSTFVASFSGNAVDFNTRLRCTAKHNCFQRWNGRGRLPLFQCVRVRWTCMVQTPHKFGSLGKGKSKTTIRHDQGAFCLNFLISDNRWSNSKLISDFRYCIAILCQSIWCHTHVTCHWLCKTFTHLKKILIKSEIVKKKTLDFHSCHRDSDINAVIFGLDIINCAPTWQRLRFACLPCKTQSHNTFMFCAVGPTWVMAPCATPKSNRQSGTNSKICTRDDVIAWWSRLTLLAWRTRHLLGKRRVVQIVGFFLDYTNLLFLIFLTTYLDIIAIFLELFLPVTASLNVWGLVQTPV